MQNKLILWFAIALMALTGIAAAPARAQQNDELGKLLAGAATLFILGNVLSQQKNRKQAAVTSNRGAQDWRWRDDYWRHHRIVPMDCFFVMRIGREKLGLFDGNCLDRHMHKADRLPRDCRVDIRGRYSDRHEFYRAACLRAHGYRAVEREVRWRDDWDDRDDKRGRGGKGRR